MKKQRNVEKFEKWILFWKRNSGKTNNIFDNLQAAFFAGYLAGMSHPRPNEKKKGKK